MFVHTIVFCWTGKTENILEICRGLVGKTDQLTLIDATTGTRPSINGVEWIRVDPQFYYGMKFRTAIELHRGDVLLQIQEDASCENWGKLIDLCRDRFCKIPNLGVWSPEVDFTGHPTDVVSLAPLDDPELRVVVQTDCIVWALNRSIVEYLRTLDYSGNNLGWGIDWAACAHAFASRMLVVRDFAVSVTHPAGSGYQHDEARRQMHSFLSQLGGAERLQYALLSSHRFHPPNSDHHRKWEIKRNPVVYALALLTPFDINKPLVRIGPHRDGGYVLVDNFKSNQVVISYGISTEYGFEQELARRGHDVYMFDHTIETINATSEKMKFCREGVAGVTKPQDNLYSIEDHLAKYDVQGDQLILKMDVEGAEIEAIGMASEACLARFEQIVLEVHGLVNLNQDDYRSKFVAMFTKLNKLFTLFHVHANNWDGPDAIHTVSGCPVSNMLELSYVRTTSVERAPSQTLYPTALDFPNTAQADKLLWFYPFVPTTLKLGDYAACEQRVALTREMQFTTNR